MAASSDENDSFRRKKGVAMDTLMYTGVPTKEYDNGRDEKPWQRVPSALIILLLGWYLLLGYLTQLVEDDMPRVINEADVPLGSTDIFSEEAAWKYLRNILGEGPRVAGTRYHLNKTADVKAMVDAIASQANQHVRTDWQMVTGDYYLRMSAPFVNWYVNASNVIAVLEGDSGYGANGTTRTSILINCHYDSVPFAMGTSDNAVFCAVMMEVLNKLSKRTKTFKHNLIFLFNGAEENSLQASHGFLKHPWAHGVRSVVNLDAAGMNGKPIVFQVTDPRVLSAYRRAVSRPAAQGFAEFVFGSGLIPSDTDFRIFRDFGNIHGIDIAFSKWGHVYHTRYDHPDLLLPGVMQNAGDMVLALMSELGDMEELADKIDPSPAVYYDYLNVFTVTYSLASAYAVDVAVVLFALLAVAYYIWTVGPRWSTIKELLYAVLGRMVAMVAGIVAVFLPASIMIATTTQLRYLSEPWIVVPLFWVPYLIGAVTASQLYDAWRTKKSGLNRSIRSVQAATATRCILLVTVVALMCARGMQYTRYLFVVPLFITSLTSLMELTLLRYVSLTGWQHLLVQVVLSLPASMFVLTLALRFDAMMLPVMGRTPTDRPDYLVAMLNVALAALLATTVCGTELLFSRRRVWVPGAVLTVTCLIFMFVPFSPYRDDGPSTQRHYWFHTEIVTFDRNNQPIERTSGVAVYKLDAYTTRWLGELTAHRTVTTSRHCDTRVYCDLPLFRTSFAKYLPEAVFIDMEGPAQFSPAAALDGARACTGETCVYTFTMSGAAHNTITLWPRDQVNITSWSFSSPVETSMYLLERPVYTIIHSLATYEEDARPYQFTVTCIVPLYAQSAPALEVSHHAHNIYHPQEFTEAYNRLINSAPKYFNIATFLSFRHNYVF